MKKKSKLDFNGITYGCELEIADCDTRIKIPKKLGKWDYKDGTICNSNGQANDPQKKVNVYGGEINTTPTKTIKKQLKNIKRIFEILKNYSFNHTTNLHIHIRIPGLKESLEDIKKLQTYVFKYSKEMLEVIEPIPKADRNLKGEDFLLAKRREKRRKKSHHWCISEKTYNRLMKAKTVEEFFESYYPRTKDGRINFAGATRSAINILQLKETETIEFRFFTCSDNLEQIKDSFLFCKKFLLSALTNQKPPLKIFRKYNFKFTPFWEFDPFLEKGFLLTNFLYNKRKIALENIEKLKRINYFKKKEV